MYINLYYIILYIPHLPPNFPPKKSGCPFGQATHLQVRLIRGPGAPSLGTRCCMCFLSGENMSCKPFEHFWCPEKGPQSPPNSNPQYVYEYIYMYYMYI